MARLVPSVTNAELDGAHRGERETLSTLKCLGPAFTVYHGVHWTRVGQTGTHFGEIDFVVVNRAGDVLVIEQKNGSLIETGDDLRKSYADGEKSAIGQLHRNVDRVRDGFREHNRQGLKRVDLLFYCPDHHVVRLNAAGLHRERIVDAPRRHNCERHMPRGSCSRRLESDHVARRLAELHRDEVDRMAEVAVLVGVAAAS